MPVALKGFTGEEMKEHGVEWADVDLPCRIFKSIFKTKLEKVLCSI